jgi:hypothetical protein
MGTFLASLLPLLNDPRQSFVSLSLSYFPGLHYRDYLSQTIINHSQVCAHRARPSQAVRDRIYGSQPSSPAFHSKITELDTRTLPEQDEYNAHQLKRYKSQRKCGQRNRKAM